jgi:hypothetical protein
MAGRFRKPRAEVDLDSMVATNATGAYEALQLYKSRAIRYKQKENNIVGAIEAAAHGAKCLLSHSYSTAGAELATQVLDFMDEANMEINPQLRGIIFDIDATFPADSQLRVEFLKAAVKVSVAHGQREFGDQQLHLRLAHCLWDINDKNAIYHFVLSEEPDQLAQKIDYTHGNTESLAQRDRSLTLAILHFLALENLRDANELFRCFKKIQKAKGLPIESELITFCDYLLQVSRRDAAPLFKTLVNTYASALNFDETAGTLLMGPIASRLFGIQPKANPMMSMLQNLLT